MLKNDYVEIDGLCKKYYYLVDNTICPEMEEKYKEDHLYKSISIKTNIKLIMNNKEQINVLKVRRTKTRSLDKI